MRHAVSLATLRDERLAAPKPARIPRATSWPLLGQGDRPTYPADEGLT